MFADDTKWQTEQETQSRWLPKIVSNVVPIFGALLCATCDIVSLLLSYCIHAKYFQYCYHTVFLKATVYSGHVTCAMMGGEAQHFKPDYNSR